MTDLLLARDLRIPAAVVTEPVGIFANRGFGKTWTAVKLVEQLYAAGLPSVVLDIKGDWFGIRSSASGNKPGLPFMIFGGDHADVPLETGSGAIVARFIAKQNVPAIIDLSAFSKTAARRWAMEFAEALYAAKRTDRSPLMVVVDEADILIPQRLSADLMRLLGAMEDIAKRGRGRGLGLTVISQRVADVNKSVTDLLTTLLLGNVTGTRTRKALMDWIDDHARSAADVEQVLSSLSTLDPGELWVWSPQFLRILQRVRIARIETFDSHATPGPGETLVAPGRMADVDIAALSAEIAATVERAKADDPKELRRLLAERDRRIAKMEIDYKLREPVIERVEVPTITEADRELARQLQSQIAAHLEQVNELFAKACAIAARAVGLVATVSNSQTDRLAKPDTRSPTSMGQNRPQKPPSPRISAPAAPTQTDTAPVKLGRAERAILSALAPYAPSSRSAKQVALMAQYSSKGGGFRNSLGALRSAGLIEGGNNAMVITDEGLAQLGDYTPLPTGRALLEHWCANSVLGRAEREALTVLVGVYPDTLSADEVATSAGYQASGGGFRNALGKLRSLELITGGNGAMRASDEFGES